MSQDGHPKCPLTVDPAGVYIRGDGPPANRTFLCGLSPGADDEDPDEPPLHVDYEWFEERIWPVRSYVLLLCWHLLLALFWYWFNWHGGTAGASRTGTML